MPRYLDVQWGRDEAKGDRNLPEYFVPVPEYNGIIAGDYRYVIGRKGTGKTAICERIRIFADNDPLCFTCSLSLRNFPLPLIRAMRDRSLADKSQFVPIWTFLILVEIARLVAADNGAQPRQGVSDIQQFLNANFPRHALGFSDTLKTLEKGHAKISILPKWIGGEAVAERSRERTVPVDYHHASKVLLDKLQQIQTPSKYFIFMDELDEGYQAGDEGLRLLLLALLRATEEVFMSLSDSRINFRPVLVLRSDIYDRLEDNDLNKLDDYTVRLKWHASATGGYSLKRIVAARIRASFPDLRNEDAWRGISVENDPALPKGVTSLWRYITTRTLERPRDLVKFLKFGAREQPADKLTFAHVKEAEYRYSEWLYNELRDEIHTHLPIWREALRCLTRLGRGVITTDELKQAFDRDVNIQKWLAKVNHDPDDILRSLFDFGVVGNLDEGGRWLFKYKDDDLGWNENMKLIVHYGFHRKLRIIPGGKRAERSRRK